MITEDYVSFETAKLLKEKGFDEHTEFCFVGEDWESPSPLTNSQLPNGRYSRPTLQMAMKWLREVHHWHIFVIPKYKDVEYRPGDWQEEMVGYQYLIISVGETNRKNEQPFITAFTPESAGEAAIKYCLENLI